MPEPAMPTDTVPPGPAAQARSTFVTIVAWIFIVGAGSTVCISLLQAIMFAFIGLMGLAILWNLGGLWLQLSMFSSIPAAPASAPPDFASQFERATRAMKIASGLSAAGLSILFAWIIKRLTSHAVRGEFNAL